MNKHTSCFACGSKNLEPLSGFYERHKMVKCKGCSLVLMEPNPSAEELDAHYANYSYDKEAYLSPLTIKSYNELLDELEKYRKTGKLLDVGCGLGWFLQEAKKRGWEVYGTEYSEKAVELCEADGIKMKLGELNPNDFPDEDFDIVTSFEVIEHLTTPNEELQNINKVLRKGGLFYCTTPNFNSLLRYHLKDDYNIILYPEHLAYYTKKTLNQVAKNNNFKVAKFLSTGISLTRLKTSKKTSNERIISEGSADEELRHKIDTKWYWGTAKLIANWLLTFTGLGMTLKGYYIKK